MTIRDNYEYILDGLRKSNRQSNSYCFGKDIAFETIDSLLDDSQSQRSLVIKINQLIREAEAERAEAIDDDDYQLLTGEIDGYKEFKKQSK